MPSHEWSQRQGAATQVCYELQMAVRASRQLPACEGQLDRNVYLEAMLLHSRNMIEFLCGRPTGTPGRSQWKPRDIRPADFLEDWNPPPEPVERLHVQLDLIDKHLSHLSWERTKDQREWTPAVIDDLATLFDAFVASMEGRPHHGTFLMARDGLR